MLLRKSALFSGVIERVDDRGNEWQKGCVLVAHELQELCFLEAGHQYERASDCQQRVQNDVESINVIERQAVQRDVIFRICGFLPRRKQLEDISHQVGMGEHHAFGKACGTAREWERSD